MDRRAFLGLATAGVIAAPGVARAQQAGKAHRIGYLTLSSDPSSTTTEAFRQGLRELGYVEGRNLIIEYRWAAGKVERLPELSAELVRLKVEVIVGMATPIVEAAKRVTSTIPIVMVVADPVGSGLVAGLARPGANVTGLSLVSTELAGKKLQLVRELLPKATRVAVLTYHGYTSPSRPYLEQMRAVAQQMGIQLVVQEVKEAGACPAPSPPCSAGGPRRSTCGPARSAVKTPSASWSWRRSTACPSCTTLEASSKRAGSSPMGRTSSRYSAGLPSTWTGS
jgi:putative tryptophan/tyrosine transport system substrate-binding protein